MKTFVFLSLRIVSLHQKSKHQQQKFSIWKVEKK